MLKIVGWTCYDDHFEEAENTKEEYKALIENIRQNGYKFSGDEHEYKDNCSPVLSNGKIMHFSWRGWGKVMADAYNLDGDYAYSLWYMSDVAPQKPVYPKKYIDFDSISEGKTIDIYLTKKDEEIFKKFWDEYEYPFYILPNYINKRIYKNDRFIIHYTNGKTSMINTINDAFFFLLDYVDDETISKSQYKGKTGQEIFNEFNKKDQTVGYISIAIENIY